MIKNLTEDDLPDSKLKLSNAIKYVIKNISIVTSITNHFQDINRIVQYRRRMIISLAKSSLYTVRIAAAKSQQQSV